MATEKRGSWIFSLRVKLLAALISVMAISGAVGLGGLDAFLHDYLHRNAESQAEKLGRTISSTLRPAMLWNSEESLSDSLAGLAKDPDVRRVWIIDKNGRVGHSADNAAIGRVLDKSHDPICTVCHKNGSVPGAVTFFTRDETGAHVLRHVRPIANEKACWGCHDRRNRLNGLLLVELSTQSFEDAVATTQKRLGATGGITLAVLVVLTLVITTLLVSRPVRSLIDGASRIGGGDLSVRVPVRGRDELAELAGSFNRMAEDLGDNLDELRNKNSELSMVYSIVEKLTKTINLGELKEIILQTLMDVFEADQVMLVSTLTQAESGETLVKTRETKRLGRIHHGGEAGGMLPGELPSDIAARWLRGDLRESVLTPDGQVLALTIHGDGARPVLLLLRRKRPFERGEVNPKLLKALADHIRAALENARLFTLAITDELTQLFTVRHFRVRVEDAAFDFQQNARPFSLLMLDLDNFKSVNDRHGHPAGDEVLRTVAQVLRNSVRPADSAYRYGGEEFGILLPDTNLASARIVAERVRRDVEALRTSLGRGEEVGVTVSIGIANCPSDGTSYDDLVRTADEALYRAKRAGRNRVSDSSEKS